MTTSLRWNLIDSFAGNRHDPAHVEHRPCPVCGHDAARTVAGFDDFQFFSDDARVGKRVPIRHVQCSRCFALYHNPCLSTAGFATLLAEAGYSYGATQGRPAEEIAWLERRGLLAPGKVFLDAGCYEGRFLGLLPDTLRRIGVDIDAPAIARGQARHPELTLIHGNFEQFSVPQPPDVITLFHVLEHLPRPVAVLEHFRRVAHGNTRLVVEVPVVEHGATNDINGFFSVMHMTHFSRASLANALARGGWAIVEWHQAPDYNGCRVLAVPADALPAEALRGDPADIGHLHRALASWHTAVAAAEDRLAAAARDWDRVILWGGGAHTEFLYQMSSLFRQRPGREYLIVDSDPLKRGRTWRGLAIHSPEVLADIDWRQTGLVISSYGGQPAIAARARELGVPPQRCLELYTSLQLH